ncbi:unnamed protein product [Linum trigynum]
MALPDKTRTHCKAAEFANTLQEVHQMVRANLEAAAGKYKKTVDKKRRHVEFNVGDFVWVFLTKDKDCFSVGGYNKLSARKIGPWK